MYKKQKQRAYLHVQPIIEEEIFFLKQLYANASFQISLGPMPYLLTQSLQVWEFWFVKSLELVTCYIRLFVVQSYLALCNPMSCSTPCSSVLYHLLEPLRFLSIQSVMLTNFLIPFSSCSQSFPASESFQMSQLFASGGQSIGVSALASVLPKNIQGWCPLGWTGWLSLQSKGLSRVFSSTTIWKQQFFSTQPSLRPNSLIYTWLLEKP